MARLASVRLLTPWQSCQLTHGHLVRSALLALERQQHLQVRIFKEHLLFVLLMVHPHLTHGNARRRHVAHITVSERIAHIITVILTCHYSNHCNTISNIDH